MINFKILKSFKSHFAVYNFINNIMEEKKNCTNTLKKKLFQKEIVMTKKDNEDLKNATKFWVFDNDYLEGDVNVRYHCTSLVNIDVLRMNIVLSMFT